MSQAKSPARTGPILPFLLTVVMAIALVSTGSPDARMVALLSGWGVPDLVARVTIYALPILALVVAFTLGREFGRGRSMPVRWAIYAVFGAVAGFILGRCIDLFAHVPRAIETVTGPLAPATATDGVLWILGGFCTVIAMMVGFVAVFGSPAMSALQADELDPEALDVRAAERTAFAWSALGMITCGAACAGLAVSRQASDPTIPVAITIVAGVLSIITSVVSWNRCDELQRRQVMQGYSVSAISVTLGTFVWALLEAMQLAPPIDAAAAFAALIVTQLVGTIFVTTQASMRTAMAAKPA